ncbi:MAG: hypothetical protein IJJ21_03595 [Firmicutes bacterium]|nr:hypothetical protein [Bacillota bacterium]
MDTMKEYDEFKSCEDMEMEQLEREAKAQRWREYERFVMDTPMSASEREQLHSWVHRGNSVYDDPGSLHLCTPCYPRPFLYAIREEREIRNALRGKSKEAQDEYLRRYMSCNEPTAAEIAWRDARERTPELIRDDVRRIRRELAHLWEFVWSEGLGEEAHEFVNERRDEETPFEW